MYTQNLYKWIYGACLKEEVSFSQTGMPIGPRFDLYEVKKRAAWRKLATG